MLLIIYLPISLGKYRRINQYVQVWFLSFQRPPLISEETPLKSEAKLNSLILALLPH